MGKNIKKNIRKPKVVEKTYSVFDMMAKCLREGLLEYRLAWACFNNRKYGDAVIMFKRSRESYTIASECATAVHNSYLEFKTGKMIEKCNNNIHSSLVELQKVRNTAVKKSTIKVYEKKSNTKIKY